MKKITLTLIISTFIALFLMGCGDNPSSSETITDTQAVTTESQVTEPDDVNLEDTIEVDEYDYGSMENPHDVTGDDIPNIREGEYVRITAPAKALHTDEGTIAVGGNDDGIWANAGLELSVSDSNGNDYFVEAYSVNPGDYEDVFYNHPPADFSYKPSKVGDYQYSGCKATIKGEVIQVIRGNETGELLGFAFSSKSVVEDLELFN